MCKYANVYASISPGHVTWRTKVNKCIIFVRTPKTTLPRSKTHVNGLLFFRHRLSVRNGSAM